MHKIVTSVKKKESLYTGDTKVLKFLSGEQTTWGTPNNSALRWLSACRLVGSLSLECAPRVPWQVSEVRWTDDDLQTGVYGCVILQRYDLLSSAGW